MRIHRSLLGQIIDTITFPIRGLFCQIDGTFGLSSLREDRMRIVHSFCKGRVLDIGCGPGNVFINNFIGNERGIGIDVFPYESVEQVVNDMTNIPFDDCSFDTITLIAVGGHIPKPKRMAEFKEFARLLKPGGKLVMTGGEYITQFMIHKWVALYDRLHGRVDMDSERGMEKDETWAIPRKEWLFYLNISPLKFVKSKKFITQWGFNTVYVAQKQIES